jgi:hypothetical protein
VFALKKETVVAEKQKKSPTRKETDLLESNIATGTAHLVDRLGVLALRAGGHHVTGLLALVADTVLLARAFARQVTDLAAVVALLSLGTVARQVTVAAARITGLLTTTSETATLGLATEATSTSVGGALTSDVANLSALVALGTTCAGSVTSITTSLDGVGVVAVTRKVTRLVATVAGLFLLGTGTLATHVAVLTTVVAHGSSTLGAFTSLMSRLAAVVASTTSSCSSAVVSTLEIHCARCLFVRAYVGFREGAEA